MRLTSHILSNQLIFISLLTLSFFCLNSISHAQTNFEYFFGRQNKNYDNVKVKKVISADTIELDNGEKIKLIGLRAPEPPQREKIQRDKYGFEVKKKVGPITPIEEQAFDFVVSLLEGKKIRIELDADHKNEDHHTLGYVFLVKDNIFANTEILRHGFSHLQIRPPNNKYNDQLRAAYQESRREHRGLQNEF